MGRVVSPTPIPLSSGRAVPALVASYDMHGRAVGLFYTQPTGHVFWLRKTEIVCFVSCLTPKQHASVFVGQKAKAKQEVGPGQADEQASMLLTLVSDLS